MEFSYYRSLLKDYLKRLGISDATKADYWSVFNNIERAHRSNGIFCPDNLLISQYEHRVNSFMEVAGHSTQRIKRVNFILRAIKAVFDNCSYNTFYLTVRSRHSFLDNTKNSTQLLNTLAKYKEALKANRLQDETISGYIRTVISFLRHTNVTSINDLKSLSALDVTHAISTLLAESLSYARKLSAIRQYITWLHRDGVIDNDLSAALDIRTPRKKPIIKYFNQEAINKLLSSLSYHSNNGITISAIINLALYTGLRCVDISNLTVNNIDWQNRTISILQSKTKVRLVIPLLDSVAVPLSKYLLEVRPLNAVSYVFCSPVSGKPLGRRGITDIFVKYRNTILGPEYKGYGIHALRRTLGSRLFQDECDTNLIKDILGHRSLSSLDRYIHADDKHLIQCNLPLIGLIARKELLDG